jgi:hypothetical protein
MNKNQMQDPNPDGKDIEKTKQIPNEITHGATPKAREGKMQ